MLKGRISIFRPTGTDHDYIEIELVDDLSRTHFLRAQIGYGDFTKALTGQSSLPCQFILHPGNVGRVVEHKVVEVFVPRGDFANRVDIARRAILVHEKDGWAGQVGDALNHHKLVAGKVEGGAFYNVTFFRYVMEEGDVEQLKNEEWVKTLAEEAWQNAPLPMSRSDGTLEWLQETIRTAIAENEQGGHP